MSFKKKQLNFLKKAGKWAPFIGGAWVGLHILVPLALLRIPVFQKYIVQIEGKLPFDIPGIG